MALQPPVSVAEFKARFSREFTYGSGLDSVRDEDITNAANDALLVFNPALWDTNTEKTAFLYANAHFLVVNMQAAGGLCPVATNTGLANRSTGIAQHKAVGQVSVSYEVPPDNVKKFPSLAPFWETEFGKRYVQMLAPRMIGVLVILPGNQAPFIAP